MRTAITIVLGLLGGALVVAGTSIRFGTWVALVLAGILCITVAVVVDLTAGASDS